jgi:tetratricopeptide (TPR) repeat protein
MKKIIISLLIFIFSSISNADERKNELDRLFNELKIKDSLISQKTEQQIWDIWSTHPTDDKLTLILSEGSKFVRNQQLSDAIDVFTKVIQLDPTWAEAWNKRATVLYLLGDYEGSQKDIDKVLELEERHFGALAGQGLVNIKLENYEKAIESYKKAKEIYPSMQSPEIMIEQIKELIKQQLI